MALNAMQSGAAYKRTLINGKAYYGKHLLLTANSCSDRLLEIDTITAFLKQLVDRIDMEAYGEPIVARFGEGIETGISGVQLITTSALMVHTNDRFKDLYLDVFSCKWFDEADVEQFVSEQFAPERINSQTVLRN